MSERKEKFTPGPMSVVEFCDQFDIIGTDGLFVGRCANLAVDPNRRSTGEMRATAHLLAAAPDTYDGCMLGLTAIPSDVFNQIPIEVRKAWQHATAKARGESK